MKGGYEKMMEKAIISQPMYGKTEREEKETRAKALAILKEKGYEIINTYFTDNEFSPEMMKKEGVVNIPLFYLAKTIEIMSKCNAVYFCSGWENSWGCKIEHEIAEAYNLDILYEK